MFNQISNLRKWTFTLFVLQDRKVEKETHGSTSTVREFTNQTPIQLTQRRTKINQPIESVFSNFTNPEVGSSILQTHQSGLAPCLISPQMGPILMIPGLKSCALPRRKGKRRKRVRSLFQWLLLLNFMGVIRLDALFRSQFSMSQLNIIPPKFLKTPQNWLFRES